MSEELKVTLNPTPSEEIVKQAKAETTIKDAKGRVITLRKPGVLAQFRLVEALGDAAKNQVYMGMVLPLIYVSEIDGDPVYQPNSKREVEALIQQLDDEGVSAVMSGVSEHFSASDPEDDKERIKK